MLGSRQALKRGLKVREVNEKFRKILLRRIELGKVYWPKMWASYNRFIATPIDDVENLTAYDLVVFFCVTQNLTEDDVRELNAKESL